MKKLLKTIWKIKRTIFWFYQNKVDKIPKISKEIEKIIIWKSIEWRDIECLKIWNWKTKILYTSLIHWNEVWTVKLAYNIIDWLHTNKSKLNNYTVFIIPCLNPDWYNLAIKNPDYFNWWKIGRFNANNIDLNRNFNTNSFTQKSIWSFWENYQENIEVYCWKSWNSEPETKAFTDFIKSNGISVLFMFHNAWKDVMWNNSEFSQKIAKTYSKKTWFKYLSNEYWEKLKQTWTAKEWCDENNISYIEVEGSNIYWSDWNVQREAIKETFFMIDYIS